MKRVLSLACLAIIICGSAPAWAQLAVFDPLNYAEALEQFAELERQYTQMVLTYQQIRAQYQHMLKMAQRVPVDMLTRYRVPAVPWRTPGTTDAYGTSGGWVSALNYGDATGAGYRQATQPLDLYGAALNQRPTEEVSRIKTQYATAELFDAAAVHALHGIGLVRQNGKQLLQVLANLEQDSLSSRDDMNTLIATLNKINALAVLSARAGQSTNQMLVSLLEERLVAGKRERDAEANDLNAHIAFVQQARDLYSRAAAGSAEAIAAFRLP